MKIILNLTSEQTLPNYFFLAENSDFDICVFFTTSRYPFNKQGQWVTDALGIPKDKIDSIEVDANNMQNIYEQLASFSLYWDDATQILLNFSCGTKPMAIGCSTYFMQHYNSVFKSFYLPFNQLTIHQVYPEFKIRNIQHNISLKDYLTVRGLSIFGKTADLNHRKKEAENIMHGVLSETPLVIKNIKNSRTQKNPADKAFWGGGWFEIYIANQIKKHFQLKKSEILCNVIINKDGFSEKHQKEYDVIFIYKDKLYIVECKYFFGQFSTGKIGKDIHKMGAVRKDFGLDAIPFFFFGNKISNPAQRNSLVEEFKSQRIAGFATQEELQNDTKFKFFLGKIQAFK